MNLLAAMTELEALKSEHVTALGGWVAEDSDLVAQMLHGTPLERREVVEAAKDVVGQTLLSMAVKDMPALRSGPDDTMIIDRAHLIQLCRGLWVDGVAVGARAAAGEERDVA